LNQAEKNRIYRQIVWDYDISPEEIEAVIKGEIKTAGHYTREGLFRKFIETYPWFTITALFDINEIRTLLTESTISMLRSQDLRKKYKFIRERLQQIISDAG